MKKIVTLLLAIVVLSSMMVSASAATEEELLTKFKEISISKHVITEVENLAANYDVTEEQGDQLMELLEIAKEAFPTDNGPGYKPPEGHESYFGAEKNPYTTEQLDTLMGIIAEACDIVGFTYEFVSSEKPMHEHDVVLIIRDTEGKIAFQYDGDLIKSLGEIDGSVDSKDNTIYYLVGGISLLVIAGIAVSVAQMKKKEQN